MTTTSSDSPIAARLAEIHHRIAAACEANQRNPQDITLLAVSKTKPISDIQTAFTLGQRHFGENYIQEWQEKAGALQDLERNGLMWHFIGHLQRNKCKFIAGHVALIHSVDSLALAQEIEKRTPEGHTQAILLQLNVGLEDSKSGFSDPEELLPLLQPETPWQRLSIQGLMAIPPYTPDPEEARPFLRQLRVWREQLVEHTQHPLPQLSMGMSHDLEVAIAEGASILRVGTAIFGERG